MYSCRRDAKGGDLKGYSLNSRVTCRCAGVRLPGWVEPGVSSPPRDLRNPLLTSSKMQAHPVPNLGTETVTT